MTYNVSINNTPFPLPSQSERNWAAQVNAFFVAISQSLLQKSGGSFSLGAEVDFGTQFGLATAYLKSKTTGSGAIPTGGWARLSRVDRISWRNIADTADVSLALNQTSGRLQAGVAFQFYADTSDVINLQPLAGEKNQGRIPSVGERVQIQSFAGVGLTVGATYWVTDVSGYTIKLYTTEGGPSYADVTSAGLGYLVILDDIMTSASTDVMKNKMAADFAYDAEVGTISGQSINTVSGKVIQRITSSDPILVQINQPTAGKVYVFINETSADITIQHNAGAATRAIYTPGGVDFLWRQYTAITFVYDSGLSAWVIIGGAAAKESSPVFINYFSDPGLEWNLSGVMPYGWAQYNDGSVAIPLDGTGGAANANVTFLVSSSSALRGPKSGILSKSSGNQQGTGYSYDFTISSVDKSIPCHVDFELLTSASYVAGDVVFYMYDVTNFTIITPTVTAVPKLDNGGRFVSSYTLSTGTQYRFILHIATTNASAWTMKIDTMVNTPTKNSRGLAGSVLGTSDAQVITNKDIDGGTAANNRRITIPKNTTANLAALARKQGTLVYDTDLNLLKFDNGSALLEVPTSSLSYATGTVNAAFSTTGGSITINASVRTITWVKIGRVVFIGGRLSVASVSSPTGALKITGLPYSGAEDCAIALAFIVSRPFDSLTQNLTGKVLNGEASITIEEFEDGDVSNAASTVTASSSFIIGGSYITAS